MEVRTIIPVLRRYFLLLMLLGILLPLWSQAPRYVLRGGQMQIELPVKIGMPQLEQFIAQYNLRQIGLHQWLQTGKSDSLRALNWQQTPGAKGIIIFRKPLEGFDLEHHVQDLLRDAGVPVESREAVVYGRNRFRDAAAVQIKDSTVTFTLRGFPRARSVSVAGSFNNWQAGRIPMTLTDSGWRVSIVLGLGKHFYKYVVDDRWITDPQNENRAQDGEGNTNSVLYVTNARFVLNGHANARKVFVAGSFNGWRDNELAMQKINGVWVLPLYLGAGTHTYKFVVDGRWLRDPNNADILPDGHGDFNSVLTNGKPRRFFLPGYADAKKVVLTGTFNGWREDELFFTRTAAGWELYHTIAPGNYGYQFIVDGNKLPDPGNPLMLRTEAGRGHSYLIVDANYTFRLKGYDKAQSVMLAGDFNDWDPGLLWMKREGDSWVLSVHLPPGKHLYKFIVDGNWITDPANKLWEQNEHGTGNSIVWIK